MRSEYIDDYETHNLNVYPPANGASIVNVGKTARIISVLGGAALTAWGVRDFSTVKGLTITLSGAYLLTRGLTGFCAINRIADKDVVHERSPALEINEVFTINRSRSDVYNFWRNFSNLSAFIKHVEAVEVIDEKKSTWKIKIPGGLGTVSWEAALEKDIANEYISWRSLPGSTIDNAGEILFLEAPGNQGTEIRMRISYRLPAGQVGALAGKLFNPAMKQMVMKDLRRFKQLTEKGVGHAMTGQPGGSDHDRKSASSRTPQGVEQMHAHHESPVLERNKPNV